MNDTESHPAPSTPFDVAKELAALKHEKQNRDLHRLPPNTTIKRRPLNHAPVASPYAGSNVQKVVYVSRKTPIMSAVKKVKKLLKHVEKRAMQSIKMTDQGSKVGTAKLVEASELLSKDGEAVIVKASGRAMAQALKVGEWFANREKEMICQVEVRPGSVSVVDDIVEAGDHESEVEFESVEDMIGNDPEGINETVKPKNNSLATTESIESSTTVQATESFIEPTQIDDTKKRKRKKRPLYDESDLPEARVRWIKTVEVLISLR